MENIWHAEFDDEHIFFAPAVGRRMFWEALFGVDIFKTTDPENEPNETQQD